MQILSVSFSVLALVAAILCLLSAGGKQAQQVRYKHLFKIACPLRSPQHMRDDDASLQLEAPNSSPIVSFEER